jgi:S1-C subfamily serine protease
MLSRSDLSRLASTLGGLPVLGCLAGSSAANAGVRYGDVLLAVDGIPTPTWGEFLEARSKCKGTMLARIFRNGAEHEIELELRPPSKSPLELIAELQEQGIGALSEASDPGIQH